MARLAPEPDDLKYFFGPQIRKRMNEARIKALRAELRAIHLADALYWAKGVRADREDRAEYRLRQNRLPQIRCELAEDFGLILPAAK
jgi:hypothetical protein